MHIPIVRRVNPADGRVHELLAQHLLVTEGPSPEARARLACVHCCAAVQGSRWTSVTCDLLDAPTALAACCGFDLCYKCIFVFGMWYFHVC